MRYIISNFFLCVVCLNVFGQNLSSDYIITPVNKMVKDFPDVFDLSSPLKSAIAFEYVLADGKSGLLGKASSLKFKDEFPEATAPDSEVNQNLKDFVLNYFIMEYIVYKDSIACLISRCPDSSYSIRCFYSEYGNWVNAGEDNRKDLADSRSYFGKFSEFWLHELRRIYEIAKVPTDTLAFVNYLKKCGKDPVEFLLNKIETYKLVTYGETHYRKPSWELCTQLIQNNKFPIFAGTIFMEFESNKQDDIDQFFLKDTMDKELLLNIFRDYMLGGWDDKARFDFLISLWNLNKKLSDTQKIRVIFTDTPRIFIEEGLKSEIQDRDKYMADIILDYLDSTSERRNALWIVGNFHACRTVQTAGAALHKKLQEKMYTISTHSPVSYNDRITHERIRHGMFDYAFFINGDQPVAFELTDSPFGNEPFDGFYVEGNGKFQDNYDGYIFFGSLDKEVSPAILLEMYNQKFILEMDRRYQLLGWDLKEAWKLDEVSVKAVLGVIKADYTPLKWENYLKPLKEGKMTN